MPTNMTPEYLAEALASLVKQGIVEDDDFEMSVATCELCGTQWGLFWRKGAQPNIPEHTEKDCNLKRFNAKLETLK